MSFKVPSQSRLQHLLPVWIWRLSEENVRCRVGTMGPWVKMHMYAVCSWYCAHSSWSELSCLHISTGGNTLVSQEGFISKPAVPLWRTNAIDFFPRMLIFWMRGSPQSVALQHFQCTLCRDIAGITIWPLGADCAKILVEHATGWGWWDDQVQA